MATATLEKTENKNTISETDDLAMYEELCRQYEDMEDGRIFMQSSYYEHQLERMGVV